MTFTTKENSGGIRIVLPPIRPTTSQLPLRPKIKLPPRPRSALPLAPLDRLKMLRKIKRNNSR